MLYADSSGLDAEAVNLEALETLVRVAGMAVELLAARRGAPGESRPAPQPAASAAQPAPESRPAAAEESRPATAPREEASAVVEEAPAREEAEPAAASAREESAAAPPSDGWTGRADVRGDASEAPQPEPAAAFAPAAPQSVTQAEVTPLGGARRYGAADMDFPVEVSEEDKRYHNEARRFARLLVSEIKLYNEQKVREGRDAGDLYQRLRDDIDRSRQMYDKRVRPEVAGRYDYFHHELVNMLAEGDTSRLGEGYPGATA